MIDGRLTSFSEWVELDEAVAPKETEHGTDGKNGEWNDKNGYVYTFFHHKPDHHVVVSIHKTHGQVGFASHRGDFTNELHPYTEDRTGTNTAFSVFGKVMHLAISGAKKHNIRNLRLKGADPKLDHAYDNFVANKHIQRHMEKHGFSYVGKNGAHHIFHNESYRD